MLAILILSIVLYASLDYVSRGFFELMEAPYGVARLGVVEGDVLWVPRGKRTWRHGDLVLASSDAGGTRRLSGNVYVAFRFEGSFLAVLCAKAGERVVVSSEGLEVGGRLLSAETIPDDGVPLPEEGKSITFEVPKGRVLAVTSVRGLYANERDALMPIVWKEVYCIAEDNLEGRATGIYLPYSRKCSFEE